MKRKMLRVVVASIAVLGGLAVAPLEASAGGTWSSASLDGVAGSNVTLNGVSCGTPTDCIAVGSYPASNTLGFHAFAMALTGTSGSMMTGADPEPNGEAQLEAVHCFSSSSCIAVGGYSTQSVGPPSALVDVLNGTTWTADLLPATGSLSALSCTSSTTCVAVGTDALVETLSGGRWVASTLATPSGGLFPSGTGISCTSATTCVASGGYSDAHGDGHALIETLSAGTWTPTTGLDPASPSAEEELSAISCTSSTSCVAVGQGLGKTLASHAFVAMLSGSTWSVTSSDLDPPGSSASYLDGVQCFDQGSCVAVGGSLDAAGDSAVLAETLSGSDWAPSTGFDPQGSSDSGLDSVSCSDAGNCTAVGESTLAGTGLPLVASTTPASPAVYAVSGRVTAAGSGTPLSGVCVSIDEIGGAASGGTVTQPDGTYEVGAGFPTGQYLIEFNAGYQCPSNTGNYAFQFYDDQPTATTAQVIDVTGGVTTPDVDASMVAGGSISGTVTAASDGASVEDTCVYAFEAGVPGYTYAVTDAEGNYSIVGLNSGAYSIEFGQVNGSTCGSSSYQSQWYAQQASQATSTAVPVIAGQPTTGVDATLAAGFLTSTTSVSASPSTTDQGGSITYSATVSGSAGTPSGSVTIADGSHTLCTVTLSATTGSCSTTGTPSGTSTITGTYSGDGLFAGSTGSTITTVDVPAPPPSPTTTATTTTPTTTPPSAPPAAAPQHGYWLVGGDGGIFTFGSAQFYGSTGSERLQRPVVGITPTSDHAGYWLDASDGGIFAFGDAGFHGSIPGLGIAPAGTPGNVRKLNAPVVGMVPSADGGGYFMVASDGGVFAFGDARFEGSCPGIGGCSGAAVAVMPDASGNGYWLVTATGHVYTFGDAHYFGAPGTQAASVTSAVRTPDGGGYWVLLSNGSVFSFGDAVSHGATVTGSQDPANAIFATSDGGGYWIGTADGAVYPFGDASNDGSVVGTRLNAPIIAAVGW